MCDPVSIGLVVAGTALKSYGQSQVASAQKRDIASNGKSYEEERARQAGFRTENQGTVADTLNAYSRPSMDAASSTAIAKRTNDYVSPLDAKNFVAQGPADNAPNSAVMSRNVATGGAAKSMSVGEAIAKAQLDGNADAGLRANLHSADNSNRIGMVNRIAGGSADAENQQQGTLQSKMRADSHQGDTFSGIGDLFTAAGSLYSMGGGAGGLQSGGISGPFSTGGMFGAKYAGNGNGEF